MAFVTEDLLQNLRDSRANFLKQLDGMQENQWNWKPYPECKSITETMAHLLCTDRVVVKGLETLQGPNWELDYAETERDPVKLRAMLIEAHQKLISYLTEHFAESPLDTEIYCFGSQTKLGSALISLAVEDSYHMGQTAYIRMASDPTWDYYAAIYGDLAA